MTSQDVLAQLNANLPPCSQSLGDARVVGWETDEMVLTVEFTSKDEHTHSGHIVQGGFVAGMIDTAMSIGVITATDRKFTPATLELKVSYLKSASQGINRAVGRVVKLGRSVAFLEGELYNVEGELLAKATSTARMLPMPTKG